MNRKDSLREKSDSDRVGGLGSSCGDGKAGPRRAGPIASTVTAQSPAAGIRAGEFLAQAFVSELDRIGLEAEGVLRESHVEPLHDLRVAARRTRSLLRELRPWLPREGRAYERRWKWLGETTGRLRDLDVLLESLSAYQTALEPPLSQSEVESLQVCLERERATALAEVRHMIGGTRFVALCKEWRQCWTGSGALMPNLTESPSLLRREATSLATAAVLRTASRMLRMTRQITPDSEVEQWHRLRIRAKRFRYLLAAFEPLMAEAQANESPTGLPAAGQLIVSLKALQRGLGELNDLAVHQQSLDELIDGAGRAAETLPWQRLEQWLGDRQVVLMEVLHPSLLEFRGQVQDSLEGLVPAP